MSHYHIKEATRDKDDLPICPECRDHRRVYDSELYTLAQEIGDKLNFGERVEMDCKNVFHDDNMQTVEQCCCYSPDHYKEELAEKERVS